jgi:cell division protein FtsL
MRLEDGLGTIIDTESKPPTLENQIMSNQSKLRGLKQNLSALSAPTRDMEIKRRRQELQNEIDSLTAATKGLIKKYEASF